MKKVRLMHMGPNPRTAAIPTSFATHDLGATWVLQNVGSHASFQQQLMMDTLINTAEKLFGRLLGVNLLA